MTPNQTPKAPVLSTPMRLLGGVSRGLSSLKKFKGWDPIGRLMVGAALIAPFFDGFRRATSETIIFIDRNGVAHLVLFLIVVLLIALAYWLFWLVGKLRRGGKPEALGMVAILLAFLGIFATLIFEEPRNQIKRLGVCLVRGEFYQHHLITGFYFVAAAGLWASSIVPLVRRLSKRAPLRACLQSASIQHRKHLESAALVSLGSDPNALQLALAISVIEAYASAAGKLVQYGTKSALLPGNFDVYAQCVKGILDFLTESRAITEASIYTLLKRPVTRWYNPLTTFVGQNRTEEAVFTRQWWEDYKTRVADFKTQKKPDPRIRMKRLILQQAEPGLTGEQVAENYYVDTREKHEEHPDAFPISNLPDYATRGTASMHLLPEVERMVTATPDRRPEDALLHLIGEFRNHQTHARPNARIWTPLVRHFQDAYHSKSVKGERDSAGNPGGIYYGYVKTIDPQFRKYANRYEDLFTVRMRLRKQPQQDEFFGIAFVDDKTGDEFGIRFLDGAEIEEMGRTFEKQWEYQGTVDHFCYCEDALRY